MAENGDIIPEEIKETAEAKSEETSSSNVENVTSTPQDQDVASTENGVQDEAEPGENEKAKEKGSEQKESKETTRKGRPRKSIDNEPTTKKMKEETPERTSRRLKNIKSGSKLPAVDGEKVLPDSRRTSRQSSSASPAKNDVSEETPTDEVKPVSEVIA